MKNFNYGSVMPDSKSRSCFFSLFVVASLICGGYFIGSEFTSKECKDRISRREVINIPQDANIIEANSNECERISRGEVINISQDANIVEANSNECEEQSRAPGSEALPKGIVAETSDLEMRPLWSSNVKKDFSKRSKSLLSMAVGIRQKKIVNQIVKKFLSSDFAVMLFHYDDKVDEWRDLEWGSQAIHVSAMNQTKWWFAKRFLHPDIVSEYKYVFLWDEDLGVQHFNPKRYLTIVEDEKLEISQPALDIGKSEVHHPITARLNKSRLHRRMYKFKGSGRCDDHSTVPPCTGWVEMMAPVFSRAAWRCVWYMIQNDLIHGWGLDKQLGYCAQGDRMKNVGIVDAEYVVHLGLPTLGSVAKSKAKSGPRKIDSRVEVRRQSLMEMQTFEKRWENAVNEDKCWVDPFKQPF